MAMSLLILRSPLLILATRDGQSSFRRCRRRSALLSRRNPRAYDLDARAPYSRSASDHVGLQEGSRPWVLGDLW